MTTWGRHIEHRREEIGGDSVCERGEGEKDRRANRKNEGIKEILCVEEREREFYLFKLTFIHAARERERERSQ